MRNGSVPPTSIAAEPINMSRPSRSKTKLLLKGLVIIHKDEDILVVDKPSGILTMGTEKEKSRTAYFILTDYVRKGCSKSRNRIFIVHRLDRDTSSPTSTPDNIIGQHPLESKCQIFLARFTLDFQVANLADWALCRVAISRSLGPVCATV